MMPNAAGSVVAQFIATLDPLSAAWVEHEHHVYKDRDLASVALVASDGAARRLVVEAVECEDGGLPMHTYWIESRGGRYDDWQDDEHIEFGETVDPAEVLADALGWFAIATHDLFERRSAAERGDG